MSRGICQSVGVSSRKGEHFPFWTKIVRTKIKPEILSLVFPFIETTMLHFFVKWHDVNCVPCFVQYFASLDVCAGFETRQVDIDTCVRGIIPINICGLRVDMEFENEVVFPTALTLLGFFQKSY